MAASVNDGQFLVALVSDLKFMSYLFNFFICFYCMYFFRNNNFLRAATLSSLFAIIGTILVAVHNGLKQEDGIVPYPQYIAVLLPIEIVWGCSEFFAMITTYFKIQLLQVQGTNRRNHIVLATVIFIFATLRIVITSIRAVEGIIWSNRTFYSHLVYYVGISVCDLLLTYLLYRDTMTVSEGNALGANSRLSDFLKYTVFGSLSRVLYMNFVMLIVACCYLDIDRRASLTQVNLTDRANNVQNFCYSLKYNFGVVFLVDLLLSKQALQSSSFTKVGTHHGSSGGALKMSGLEKRTQQPAVASAPKKSAPA